MKHHASDPSKKYILRSFIDPDDDYPKYCYPQELSSFNISSSFLCPLSNGILNNPVSDSCGHMFCESCIKRWLKDGNDVCPISQKPLIINQLKLNYVVKNCIDDMWVNCSNKDKGCKWKGKLPELFNHIKMLRCQCLKYKCIHEKCNEKIFLQQYYDHITYKCPQRSVAYIDSQRRPVVNLTVLFF